MSATPTPLPYRDPAKSADERTADLLARMTLEEKVAQMLCVWQKKPAMLVDDQGRFDAAKARAALRPRPRPRAGRPAERRGRRPGRARDGGADQRHPAVLRRGVPPRHSGHLPRGVPARPRRAGGHELPAADRPGRDVRSGAGRAALRDDGGRGARARHAPGAHAGGGRGARSALGPRRGDLRRRPVSGGAAWASRRSAASRATRPSRDKRRVIATLKHFAAHGQPESGTNCAPVNVSMRVLREMFLSTFKAAVLEGGALSVMASYNEIDGVPSHANRWLLDDVLRGEWGFHGFVVSDYFAIRELHERRRTRPATTWLATAGRPQSWPSAPAWTSSCPTRTAIRISSSSSARASSPSR